MVLYGEASPYLYILNMALMTLDVNVAEIFQ